MGEIILVFLFILILCLIIEYIEYILAIILVVAVIAGIASIIALINKSVKKKKEAHLKSILEKIQEITKKYTPEDIFSRRNNISLKDRDIIKNNLKSKMPEKLATREELDGRINNILSCNGISSSDAKLKYLKSRLADLDSLTRQISEIDEEIFAELDSASGVMSKVNSVISAYAHQKSSCTIVEEYEAFTDKDACEDITDLVHSHKARIAKNVSLYNAAVEKLDVILSHHKAEAETPEKMLLHLHHEQDRLNELKKECSDCRKEIDGFTLKIDCCDSKTTEKIKKALSELLASKKCSSVSTSTEPFVPKSLPRELELFEYDIKPAVIFIDDFYFCIFSSVILVFDKNGAFSSVLNPSALKISVERKHTKYRFDRNSDSDSKAVMFTETKTTWVYTKKDGTPDRRYKNNPIIKIPVTAHGWEYGTINVKIGSRAAEFTVSSSAALDAFESVKEIYSGSSIKKSVSEAIALEEKELNDDNEVIPPISAYIETKNRR